VLTITGIFLHFPGCFCALRRKSCNAQALSPPAKKCCSSGIQEDPARNRPDGRPKIFQSEVQRVELVYHTDYIYELTDRFFIYPGFSLPPTTDIFSKSARLYFRSSTVKNCVFSSRLTCRRRADSGNTLSRACSRILLAQKKR
jgi:hypothetical protein